MNKNTYTCGICGEEFISSNASLLKKHIEKDHSLVWEDYLREYHPELGTGYCVICGNPTSFKNIIDGFCACCSKGCATKLKHQLRTDERKAEIQEKAKKTNLERYGCENPFQADQFKEKASKTKLEKYGSETYSNHEKSKQTCLERYGVEYNFQDKTCRDKAKQTSKEKYGSETYNNREQAKETCLKNFGVEHQLQSNIIQEKIKQTNLERYGADRPLRVQEIKDRVQKTNLERYGCIVPSKNSSVKLKIGNKIRERRYNLFKSQLLKFKNLELLDSKEEYISNEVHRYFCSVHGEFELEGTNIQTVSCPLCCLDNSNISNLEKDVAAFLSQYIDLETSNRTILSPLELDIFIPSKNLAIEFDGLYWHSNIFKEKNYHLNKTLSCEDQDIQLIHIFENEWINKRPIVESILLAKLGIFQKRLFARKCIIKQVSSELYREFTELNHLQGYVPAKLSLGLFYEDELVEVCSFGKSRFKKDEIELLRHCSKLHHQIIGGFSKLIKAWKKLNPKETLYTYCDRRYSNGSSYEKSGWTKVSESAPNYFYIVDGKLESRIKYQKHKLSGILKTFEQDLTEQENMLNNGYKWIYDCGNLKFNFI